MKPIERMPSAKVAGIIDDAEKAFDRRLKLIEESIDVNNMALFGYLIRLTGNYADAEDLLAKLWKIVLLKFAEDQIKILPLLYAKSLQIFLDFYRSRAKRNELVMSEVPETVIVPHLSREAYTDEEEIALKKRFWEQFPGISLTDMQREVIYMYARFGYTYKELEEEFGIPDATICDWIALARKLLSKYVTLQK